MGCQIGYYMHSGYHQAKLARDRQPIASVLGAPGLSEKDKAKLRLVGEVKAFGESTLGLAKSKNYTTFVQLSEPYVTYIVQAALAFELTPYRWHFPFVGDVPYKGYFRRQLAEDEAAGFDHAKYDVYVRGVSAYSTLGWFQDSVLSSMLRYDDIDLAETILHETVHTTLYVKSAADFNERMAVFMGHEGMRLFYLAKEGPDSPHLKSAVLEGEDQKLFSSFLTREVESLKTWYADNRSRMTPELKAGRLEEIRGRYNAQVKPHLHSRGYPEFEGQGLNNALLLAYRTYEYSLDDFARVYDHFGRDYRKTLEWLKGLERDPHPEEMLKRGA